MLRLLRRSTQLRKRGENLIQIEQQSRLVQLTGGLETVLDEDIVGVEIADVDLPAKDWPILWQRSLQRQLTC